MSDRELLELAAKAYGFGATHGTCWTKSEYPRGSGLEGALWNYMGHMDTAELWNPLTDDGDAFRLALKLRIQIEYVDEMDSVMCSLPGSMGATSVAAIGDVELRYAIVQAAAQLGATL